MFTYTMFCVMILFGAVVIGFVYSWIRTSNEDVVHHSKYILKVFNSFCPSFRSPFEYPESSQIHNVWQDF